MEQLEKLAKLAVEGKITRRQFLARAVAMGLSAVAASNLLAACAPQATPTPTPKPTAVPPTAVPPTAVPPTAVPPTAVPAFDWKRYAGTKLTALFVSNQMCEALEKRHTAFEELTGIDVDFQILEAAAMWDKQAVDFAAGAGEIDVWHTHLPNNGAKYWRAQWYEPLKPYVDNPALTNPDFDFADFGLAATGTIYDTLVGIPLFLETNTLYHNLDLMKQAGIDHVPQTMDELEEAAKKVSELGPEIYGWTTRGFSPYNTSTFCQVFFSYGGEWFDANGKANLNSPEAIAAMDWYGRMLRLYGPPAADSLDWTRASELFAASQVGFFTDSPGFNSLFNDPTKSKVVGKFRMATWPAGPAGSVPNLGGWAACIGKYSKNKEAAWTYVQWMTGKEEMMAVGKMSGSPPSRMSLLRDPEYVAATEKDYPGMLAAMEDAIKRGRADVYPPTEVAMEGRTVLADALVKCIQGMDAKAAADEANAKFQAILDKESA